jgi:hypothetical protein
MLTLDYIAKNIIRHETWQSLLEFYGIEISSDISRTGCDTYSVVQRGKFIKKVGYQEHSDVMYRLHQLKNNVLTHMSGEVEILFNNDNLNKFYIIIKELGCNGPEPKK